MPLNKDTRKQVADRKAEILSVSESLFRENGFVSTSIEDITRRVGIAHGTFYRYFRTKDDLLVSLVEARIDAMCEQLVSLRANEQLDSMQKLLQVAGALDSGRNFRVAVDFLSFGFIRQDPVVHERIMNHAIIALTPELALLLQQGVDRGELDVPNPTAMALQIILLGGELVHRADMTQKVIPWPQLYQQFLDLIARLATPNRPGLS
ncbi:MAG: TetR/AcrR family transcriptional regulator [Candidatus Sumerlaeia bacterium]|nr:TetR/AcrR family transcriptional regulator [Candidatus Sumerlaeia bacterium]